MAQPPEKSEGAFRTIREVADWLAVPTHVLRFWESKFEMISPVKGAGGRRYYRPDDMRLLGGIKVLLHDQGLTIRGVSQRIEAEGVEPVMALSPSLEADEQPAPAARRVIRSDDDAAPRVVPFQARPGPDAEGPRIRREGAEPDEEALDGAAQPEDDPTPAQPVGAPSPPQPDDGDLHAPRLPAQPTDDDASRTARAPSDPPGRDADPEDEGDDDREPGSDGAGATDGPRRDPTRRSTQDAPPAVAARVLTAAPGRRRRLRRIVQRLRALIGDLEQDLSGGADR